MGPEGSLPSSQQPTTYPYSVLDQSCRRPHIVFL